MLPVRGCMHEAAVSDLVKWSNNDLLKTPWHRSETVFLSVL